MNEYEDDYNFRDEDEFYIDNEDYLDFWDTFSDEEDEDNLDDDYGSLITKNPSPKDPSLGDTVEPERELVKV